MRIYELPIMYYREMRRLFKVQVEREPQLAPFFRTLHEPEWKLERKDSELREADLIVVPADFVKASVQRHLNLKTPIVVNPYGADINVAAKEWGPEDLRGPIRLLFIGKLSPRKGLHILFEALAGLPAHQFHLTLVGLSEQPYLDWLSNRYRVDYEWHGGMGRDAVYGECRKAHALVLPSLAEGFGLVLLEAMASGIPIIGTDQTAARDLVDDDVEGWTVPSGSAECLRECLVRMLGLRDTLPDMGAAARRKAESFSWANYRERVRTLILPAITRGS
jgi:glycosyltransferase involved in cell wall biosynthesis